MIAIREDFIKPTRCWKPRAYFSKGKCATNSDNTSQNPCCKKHRGCACFLRYNGRAAKNTNANNQTDNNHGKVKKAEFWFYAHAVARFG